MKQWTAIALTALIIGSGVTGLPQNVGADEKISVVVSIPPQKYFVEAIGGPHVDVIVMVPPGHAPEIFEPKPAQMKQLAAAKVYFAMGVPFESAWLPRFSSFNSKMTIVHTDKGIEKQAINRHDEQGPIHGVQKPHAHHDSAHRHDHHHHDCGINDPHIWLSPPLVKIQARHILTGLIQASPQLQPEFEANYASFIDRLEKLHNELEQLFADHEGGLFLVFHPSWGYFADAYGLRQVSIEIDGKEPKARELQSLIAYARDTGISTIFIQPQFSSQQARILADEINGSLVDADPLAENWFENIQSVAAALNNALR
jgi:zinc transport system substrate-binding protein